MLCVHHFCQSRQKWRKSDELAEPSDPPSSNKGTVKLSHFTIAAVHQPAPAQGVSTYGSYSERTSPTLDRARLRLSGTFAPSRDKSVHPPRRACPSTRDATLAGKRSHLAALGLTPAEGNRPGVQPVCTCKTSKHGKGLSARPRLFRTTMPFPALQSPGGFESTDLRPARSATHSRLGWVTDADN